MPKKKQKRGRAQADQRRCFEGILYILRSGAQWKLLPPYFGPPSTVHGAFMRWAKSGIFDKILEKVRRYYLKKNDKNIWYAIDANHAKVPLAKFSGKSPVDRRKRGVKKTIIVDRRGAPLFVAVGPGNTHDSQFFTEVVSQIPSKEKPQILVADSAYDVKKFRKFCSKKNIAFVATTKPRREKNKRKIYPKHR